MQAEPGEQRPVALGLGVGGGQQPLAVEDGVGAGQEGQRLGGIVHLLAAGGEAHVALRHQDAGHGDGADERDGVQVLHVLQGRARHLDQHVDGHRLRVWLEPHQLLEQGGAVAGGLAHAQDPAGAHLHAGVAYVAEGRQAVGVAAGGDDLAVVVRRGVEVVVVVVQARLGQAPGLVAVHHPQGHAGLEPQRLDPAHHLQHRIEVLLPRALPGRAHAEAAGAGGLRRLGLLDHLLDLHELLPGKPGAVVGRLGAVLAVLRAGAGLDGEQGGDLHGVGVEVGAVHPLGVEQQVVEGQGEERLDLLEGPVVADRGLGG